MPLPFWLVPLWLDGVVVLVLVPGSGIERLGVTGPLGVEPRAGEPPGEPGDVAPPVVPEAEPADPEPPPEPDDWAWADVIERTTASAAKSCLFECFIEEKRHALSPVP